MAEDILQNQILLNTCMICGLSTFNPYDHDELGAWLGKVLLLCDPDDELDALCPALDHANINQLILPTTCEARTQNFRPRSEASPIEVSPGIISGPGTYTQLPKDEESPEASLFVRVLPLRGRYGPRQSDKRKHYLPIHEVCWNMAERLWKTSPDTAHINDPRGLFLALAWRYTMGTKNYDVKHYEFPPNCRMGPDFRMWADWLRRWKNNEHFVPAASLPGPAENPMDNVKDLWVIDPTTSISITDLLQNLEQTPRREPTKFDTLFFGLPPEARGLIVNALPFRDLPRVASGILPQSFWLRQLKTGRALPWLWETRSGEHALNAKADEACHGGDDFEWNWELFVRQLSRGVDFGVKADVPAGTNPFAPITKDGKVVRSDATFWETTGYYNDLKHVPPGLFNRRRIWQLLEEMFVGDHVPMADTERPYVTHTIRPMYVVKDCIQIPWDISGRPLKNPKWIPSFDLEPYVRRIGGDVYIRDDLLRPMQYWQDPGGYWKRAGAVSKEDLRRLGPKEAPPRHVLQVLRRRGYPI